MTWILTKEAFDKLPERWINDCRKMYKISNKVIRFITKAMKNWKVKLTTRGKTLTRMQIQIGIFQRDTLLPLLFIIAMMPLKYTGGYTFIKLQEKFNHLLYLDYIKLFVKEEKNGRL